MQRVLEWCNCPALLISSTFLVAFVCATCRAVPITVSRSVSASYPMPESAASVANYFLRKADGSCPPVTPMKLLKLVYIAHGWHLGIAGTPLIDEPIQAWKYGPVITSLYHHLKEYGDKSVPAEAFADFQTSLGDGVAAFLDAVWTKYCAFTGGQLSTLTHQKGSPWYETWNDNRGCLRRGTVIPVELIKDHYQQKANG